MKLWGGRFLGQSDEAASHFHSSISFDQRLCSYDIIGSIAHAEMLGKQGIIPASDAAAIAEALETMLEDIEKGALEISSDAEDIHTFVESVLISRIGEAGRKLHTGRSRNDQVALDMRMYVIDEIDATKALIVDLLEALRIAAKTHAGSIMPGYTHLQKAQPVTLGHHLLAYFQMFKRDYQRLEDCRSRTDVMPLGSGALAATTYPLDRDYVRAKLGFAEISANSLDAVSDRDFCIEFVSSLSMIMMHLSRFCEELILWSTDAFSFAEISDAYTTGSSIMPQKKNPDMAELIRGKTGRVYGCLIGLLTMMKGLPLAYNKDMQEDKEALFDAADTAKACLAVFTGMLGSIAFHIETMYDNARGGYMNATDLADWLVKKGVAFRDAHEIIGKLVLFAIEKQVSLNELSLEELKSASVVFDETAYEAIRVETGIDSRNLPGGPGGIAIQQALADAEKWLSEVMRDD